MASPPTNSHLTFASLFLPPPILAALTALSYHHPSPIQLHCIPPALHGVDIIAQAHAGTGKSLVFAVLALAHALRRPSPPRRGLSSLILVPTRELGSQVEGVISALAQQVGGVRVESVMGGKGSVREDSERVAACDVLVATVGRLKHLMDEGQLRAEQLSLLVLDEADALLSPSSSSFSDVNAILAFLPSFPQRQTLLFSATWPLSVMHRAREVTADAEVIMLDSQKPHHTIRHFVLYVDLPTQSPAPIPGPDSSSSALPPSLGEVGAGAADAEFDSKFSALLMLLASFPFHQCLVFARSHAHAALLPHSLTVHGYPALPLSSTLTPAVRASTMASFRSLRTRILVTSDLLSRGFDHPTINLIVHWDDAYDPEAFLHRSGRTGRWGRKGRSVWIVERGGEERVARMERLAGIRVDELKVRDGRAVVDGDEGGYDEEVRRQARQLRADAEQGWALDRFRAARRDAVHEMDDGERSREGMRTEAVEEGEMEAGDMKGLEGEGAGGGEWTMPEFVVPFSPFRDGRVMGGEVPPVFPAVSALFPLDVLHLSSHARQAAEQFHAQFAIQ